jgi:hypothetical protein
MSGGSSVDRVASALLYEGYLLYPYRRSALKNRQRFNFGVIYPREYSEALRGGEPCEMRTECLVEGSSEAELDVTVRFLHLFERTAEPGELAWHGAIEREVTLRVERSVLRGAPRALRFGFPAADAPGRQMGLTGRVELAAQEAQPGVDRVRVAISNLTPMDDTAMASRDEVMLRSLVSTHTILRTAGGEFLSLTDPPAGVKGTAAACENIGTWPVLAGENGARDTVLSSPIIVPDFPGIAPESPGDFFDGTEMDEMLSLRILTLTDEEKREMAESDERARELLARTEAFEEQHLRRMHGVLREIRSLEAP